MKQHRTKCRLTNLQLMHSGSLQEMLIWKAAHQDYDIICLYNESRDPELSFGTLGVVVVLLLIENGNILHACQAGRRWGEKSGKSLRSTEPLVLTNLGFWQNLPLELELPLLGKYWLVPWWISASMVMEITVDSFHVSFGIIGQLWKVFQSLSGQQNHLCSPIWASGRIFL